LYYENSTDKFQLKEVKDYRTFAALEDVDVSLIGNGKIPKYNASTSKFEMMDDAGFPEVSGNQNYVRNVGQWDTLASTTEITTL